MSTALDHVRPVASPGRISQGTAIEQSRAIAQVQAMVIVAQQCPRSVPGAIRAMEEACRQTELAEKAFFRFPRAGGAVEGPSVHLARELARCWGNIEHGVSELRRDDLAAESEMQAFAWDLETNTRSASIFIVPHKRDTKTGVKDLTDMRDIYENNANNGARRLREAIFSTLPVWYRARAERLCRETLESGGGRPLAQRIADAVTAFERYRVSPARLAAKFGYAGLDELTAADVAQLGIIYDSLRQGTVTVDDEFPPEQPRVTAADITGQQPEAKATGTRQRKQATPKGDGDPLPPPPEDPGPDGGGRPPMAASEGQVGAIRGHFKRLGYADNDEDRAGRLRRTAALAGREGPLETTKHLTADEAARVLRQIIPVTSPQELDDLLATGEVPGDGQ
jgi:hypothetical protein